MVSIIQSPFTVYHKCYFFSETVDQSVTFSILLIPQGDYLVLL